MFTKLFTLVLAAGLVLAGCNTASDMSPTEPSSKSGATIQDGNGAYTGSYTFTFGWYTCDGKWVTGEATVHYVWHNVQQEDGTWMWMNKSTLKGRGYDEDGVKYEFKDNWSYKEAAGECGWEGNYTGKTRLIRPGGKNNEFVNYKSSWTFNFCTWEWDNDFEVEYECNK